MSRPYCQTCERNYDLRTATYTAMAPSWLNNPQPLCDRHAKSFAAAYTELDIPYTLTRITTTPLLWRGKEPTL